MNLLALLAVAGAACALLAWPRHGLGARWRRNRAAAERIRREDALKHLLKCEANGLAATSLSLGGALGLREAEAAALLRDLENRGLVSFAGGRLALQPDGRGIALHVVRAHRLWERHLAEETGVAEARWHRLAERQEHRLTPAEADVLAARLGHPLSDPHGDAIPAPGGGLSADAGQPVNAIATGQPFMLVHIEDEPEDVYAALLQRGLRPGMRGYVMGRSPAALRLWIEGQEVELRPSMAQQLSARELQAVSRADLRGERTLADLPPGARGGVIGLSASCRGAERRRLLDLGFVPGSVVEARFASPAGDPTAYEVRGALVALRRDQACHVRIAAEGEVAA
jgi:DtxR family Mn-dependent transcriptional regulator